MTLRPDSAQDEHDEMLIELQDQRRLPEQPLSLLEAAALDINSQLRAFGHTVTVTAESDGPEYQAFFPPNRESAKRASASPASTSSPDPKTVK